MRVLILSQYYNPEPIPKAAELADALRRRGHEVTVVTGFPNYPAGVLYPGYHLRFLKREKVDGIPVTRAYEYPYHGRSVIRRMMNYGSFVLSAPIASLTHNRADVMYVWHPPLTIGVAAWIISKCRRIPFVYDVQDIWPESVVLSGMVASGILVRAMSILERFVYRRSAHLLVVTEGARNNLIHKGVPAEKVTVMPHWIDDDAFGPPPIQKREAIRRQYGWSGRFVVMFAGNIGIVQGLDSVVRAASRLRNGDVTIVFVGDGSDRQRLEQLSKSLALGSRVQFIGRQDASQMREYFSAADALLVHLKRSQLSHFIIPTKTLAYLAAEKPVIMAMNGAAADLIRRAGAGMVVEPEDEESIAAAVDTMSRLPTERRMELGRRGGAFVREHHKKERVIDQYESLLESVAKASS